MQRIDCILMPGFQVMLLGVVSVFEMANRCEGGPFYDVRLLSESGGPVLSSLGYALNTEPLDGVHADTVLVSAAIDVELASPGIIQYLTQAVVSTRRVASLCTGAFVLAQAGLLDHRRATTHWGYARLLKETYPKIRVDEDRIFVIDGPVWTSAGMTAGIDLALAMVDKDLGTDIARLVSKKLVVFHRRAGGQLQHSALLELGARSDRIQNALIHAKGHLQSSLTVDVLADAANLSVRQFSRAFREETGQSPAKAVEQLRVETARLMMEQGRLPIEVVARETGFADSERMRRAFLRAFGQPPQVIRRNSQTPPPAKRTLGPVHRDD